MTVDLRGVVLTNWPIKLTALALATVLWAAVAAEQPTTLLVPVSLIVEAPEGRALTRPLPPVRALYSGSARELLKLRGSPPVITKVIPDTLTGSHLVLELSPSDLTLVEDADVQAQDVQPRHIDVVLDEVARRTVGVVPRVTILPDSGYTLVGGIAVTPSTVLIHGPDYAVQEVRSVATVPVEIRRATGPVRRSVPLDTSRLGTVQLARREVEITADVEPLSERVLMEIPVTVQGDGGSWSSEPNVVMVRVRGPTSRVTYLTRDSVAVIAPVTGTARRQTVPLSAIAPPGVEAAATPDSATVERRGRGS